MESCPGYFWMKLRNWANFGSGPNPDDQFMNTPLLVFNIVFYGILLILYGQARQDPSSSLGVGFFALFIFALFPILQILLWRTKIIKVTSILDKIGMITATPVLPILFIIIASTLSRGNARSSTYEFNANNRRYQVAYYDYPDLMHRKKIEIYKSVDTVSETSPYPQTDKWLKDSIWLYFSKTGDTIKKEYYRNDTLLLRTSANTGLPK